MSGRPVVVLKFGSSVLPGPEALPRAVHEIHAAWRSGRDVVAVVSALGRTTDRLLAEARSFGPDPDPLAVAALAGTGEAAAAALLGLALDRAGIPAEALDAASFGLRARGPALDAEPEAFDPGPLRAALARVPVAVVPGFVARDDAGRAALLGRGGSDLTALAVAAGLGAEACRLVKDVDGLRAGDPRAGGPAPERFAAITFEDARRLAARALQAKALAFAAARGLRFDVGALLGPPGTLVGAEATRREPAAGPVPRLRVALLGAGAVGGGVLAHLLAMPDRFEVAAVLVRDPARHAAAGIPAGLLTADPEAALAARCDVVAEALSGEEPAASLLAAALADGRHAVTANKRVVAAHGPRLEALARKNGVRFGFAAAVGGAVPMVEAVRAAAADGAVRSLAGILNGTANFVLDRVAAGDTLAEAVVEAKRRGLAEADPRDDLDGSDSARKLAILARAAFGAGPRAEAWSVRGIEDLGEDRIRAAARAGSPFRLVARVGAGPDGPWASVGPEEVPPDAPLAGVAGDANRLVVTPAAGPARAVSGRGAGRWPAAEAVLGDVLDLARESPGRARPDAPWTGPLRPATAPEAALADAIAAGTR